jgi:hypothetical protein
MNKAHLTQLWHWLSIVCVLFLVTSIISLQGGSEFLGRLFGDKGGATVDNKPAIGYFGTVVGAGLFLLALSVLLLHARRYGNQWHSRIPVVWLEGLNTSAWEAKVFQTCILVIFVAMPFAGIIRCMSEAEIGDICEQDTKNFYKGSETTLLWPPAAKEGKQMRLRKGGAGPEPCSSGVELFPRSLTPLAIYGLPLAASGMVSFALASIFLRRKSEDSIETSESDPTFG